MNNYFIFLSDFRRCLFFKLQLLTLLVLCAQLLTAQENKVDERPLAIGETTERKVVGQEVHAYGITLKRGQVLHIKIQEKGADVITYVGRFSNQQAVPVSAFSNSGTGFMQESVTAIADQDGVYGLGVIARQSDEDVDARYELSATLDNAATANDTQRMQAEKFIAEASQIAGTNDLAKIPLAISNLENGLKIWQLLGDKYWEAITKMWIGSLEGKNGDFYKAETNMMQALNLFDKVKNKPEIGNLNFLLGTVYAAKNDSVNSKKYLIAALEIYRNIGDKRMIKSLNSISSTDLTQATINNSQNGTAKNKFPDFEKLLNEAKKNNDEAAQVSIWIQYLSAYALEDAGETEIDFSRLNGSNVLAMMQELKERRNTIDEKIHQVYERADRDALSLAKKLKDNNAEMKMLVYLGIGYSNLSDKKTAANQDESDDEEKIISNPVSENKSKNYLIQGLALAKIQNDKLYEILAYSGLSTMYEEVEHKLGIFFGKKYTNSLQSYRKLFVGLANREDQKALAKYVQPAYEALAVMLCEVDRFEEAIQVINFGRDQEFFDNKLVDNQTNNKVSLTSNEAATDIAFDNFLNEIIRKYTDRPNTNYLTAANEIKNFFNSLEQKFDDKKKSDDDIVRDVKDAVDFRAALNDLSKSTGKKHVAIYHVTFDGEDHEILLVTPEYIKFFSYGDNAIPDVYQEEYDELYTDFLKVLTSPEKDPRPLGSIIYKGIFKTKESVSDEIGDETLETELEKDKAQVLHWSLSGKLRYIPIAALYDEERKQYLVEQYENVIFTRAKKESFLLPPKRWTNGMGFGRTFENDLPFVKKELDSIFGDGTTNQQALFRGNVYINNLFNRQSLLSIRQIKPDFVHIASHFNFEPGKAGESFLKLGDGKEMSLIDMQLNAGLFEGIDLLTLSACQTAVQREDANGKEIDGFAELAQRLGAKSVIATLWSINDPSAYQLMSKFYALKQENPDASKAEILRLAQLTLLYGIEDWDKGLKNRQENRAFGNTSKNNSSETTNNYTNITYTSSSKAPFAHPYYWAAYVLYGGSNGGKTTKNYNIPQPPPRVSVNNSENTNFNRASVAGTWSGKYVCGQGVTGATLKMSQTGNEIQGLFEFYPLPENPTFRAGSGIYKGIFDPNIGVMQLNGVRWVNQPDINWILVGFSGSFDDNRQIFTGRMLSPNCGGIELKRDNTDLLGNNFNFGSNNSTIPKVSLKDIESSFNNKMFDETIRLGNIFLQSTPESKEANSYVGYSYLLKQDVNNAVNYFEKAVKLGQPVIIPMKRLRIPLLGHAFEEVKLVVLNEGVAIDDGNSVFLAKYSELTEAQNNNYFANFTRQCGTIHLSGMFTEVKKKSEKKKQDKKKFDLFTMSAYLQPKLVGQMTINEAACNSLEDFVPTTIISLISRLK